MIIILKKIKAYPKKTYYDLIKIYMLVFSTVIIGITCVRAFTYRELYPLTEQERELLAYNALEETDKTLTIGGVKYFLVYERESNKYLVFASYNNYLGYISLNSGESINSINEKNLLDKIQLDD